MIDFFSLLIRVGKKVKQIFVGKLNPILFIVYDNDTRRYHIEGLYDPFFHLFNITQMMFPTYHFSLLLLVFEDEIEVKMNGTRDLVRAAHVKDHCENQIVIVVA